MLEGRLLPLQLGDFALQGGDQGASGREIVDVATVLRHAVIIRDAGPQDKHRTRRSRATLVPSAPAGARNVDAGEQQREISAAHLHRSRAVLLRPGEGAAFKTLV